ncbi:MAG TPA: response regulator transcription factor [Paenibacillus sp.]|nr:response regulator transcription factor [Paenibacillus sp.]
MTTPHDDDRITILLADDHPVYTEGLAMILRAAPDIDIVGTAASGREAVELAEALQPDVVLMDVHMPDGNGIESARAIREASPHIAVLMLTMLEDDATVFSAMRAGARGYLLKGARGREIVRAVYAAADGESIFSPALARRMMYYFESFRPPEAEADAFPQLTAREKEVLALIAQGRSNAEIGGLLGLAPKTVRNHVSNVLNKLQVADRARAIVVARESGLGGRGKP